MDDSRHRRRGTASNRSGRFESLATEAADDGWGRAPDEELPPLRSTVTIDATRSIIARNQSPDIGFDRSINPYRGCEHGCVYCFARPTHAYLGLSPGLDFETRLFAKPDAPALLEAELRRKGYACAPLAIGTNTDPYQPIERERGIMRGILEVLEGFGHPVVITTKSAIVERDVDILSRMAARGLAQVALSVTTLDRDLARTLEPRASPPMKRLAAVRRLAEAGVPTMVMVAPVIPLLTDPEMERILDQAKAHGARGASMILLRLPLEIKDLFTEWLHRHAPGKAGHVLSLLRQSRDGALYRAEWGKRMTGSGPYAELLQQRFRLATKRLGLDQPLPPLDNGQFMPPPKPGDQMTLF